MGDSDENSATIEKILRNALMRLKRMDTYEGYLDYIRSEWYSSVSDMLLALEDGKAWTDLKLPGRLKLEIKSELLGLQAKKIDHTARPPSDNKVTPTKSIPVIKMERWTKCYSPADSCYFFYHEESQVTQWETPTGNVEIEDDISSASTPVASQKCATSNKKCANLDFPTIFDSLLEQALHTYTASPQSHQSSLWNASHESLTADLISSDPGTISVVACDSNFSSGANIVIVNAYAVPDDVTLGVADSTDCDDMNTSPTLLSASSVGGSADEDDSEDSEDSGPDMLIAQRLVDMGFTLSDATAALRRSDNNLSSAASILLQTRRPSLPPRSAVTAPKIKPGKIAKSIVNRLGFRVAPPPAAPSAPPFVSRS